MYAVLFLLCCLFMAYFSATVTAIQCYACESVYEPECAEEFDAGNHFKLDCSKISPPRYIEPDLVVKNSTGCMKMVYEELGVRKFVRSCFFGDVNDTEIGCRMDPTLPEVQQTACHVCANENYCNAAQHLGISLWSMASIALLRYLLRRETISNRIEIFGSS